MTNISSPTLAIVAAASAAAALALSLAAVAVTITGCAAPINTQGVESRTAARCTLMAHQEDRSHVAFGLIPAMIVQHNADQRRQEIFDACVAAGGSRELPSETLPALPEQTARP